MRSIINGSKSFFALIGLLSIISISIYTVIILNPKEYQQDNIDTVSKVLGENTDNLENLPLLVYDLNSDNSVKTSLKNNSSTYGQYIYTTSFKLMESNQITNDFLKINNPNNTKKKANISLLIKGEILNNIKIKLIDNLDEVVLYTPGHPFTQQINIEGLSSRIFKIKYEFNQKINYPFEIQFFIN